MKTTSTEIATSVSTNSTAANNDKFLDLVVSTFAGLRPEGKVLVTCLVVVVIMKGSSVVAKHARALYRGYCRADNGLQWLRETTFGLFMMAFNPFKAVTWLAIFLTRNMLGLTPYFAWSFFISLVLYILIGMTILTKSAPGGWVRPIFFVLSPTWLIVLTALYDWGYFPMAVVIPTALSSVPVTFRLAAVWIMPFPPLSGRYRRGGR